MCFPDARQKLTAGQAVLLDIALDDRCLGPVRLMVARDSSDEGCAKAFKRVALKARPNKGSLFSQAQALNATKETWAKARHFKTRNREGPKKRGSSTLAPLRRSARQVRRMLQIKKVHSVTKSQTSSSRKVCSALVEKKGAATGYRK